MALQRKTDWSIRKAAVPDDDGVVDLIGKYGWRRSEKSRALYRWTYRERSRGETLTLIASNRVNEVVATSLFLPWTFSLDGKTIPACQWSDLYVELEYRGQAIPDLLLKQGLEETRRSGVQVCFAFPTNQSAPLHKRNRG